MASVALPNFGDEVHHKRKRPKNTRAGCLMCKPHKANGVTKTVKIKGLRVTRKLKDID